MSNKLTDLRVKEISFCKQGAVPDAIINIFKSADPVEPTPEVTNHSVNEESLLSKVAKVFGLVRKDSEPVTIAKGVFTDAWTAKELRSNFYDAFWTLDDVCWSIMNDDTITDKASAISQACTEFASLIPSLMGVEQIAKMAEVRESLVKPVRSQIEKALVPNEEPVNKEGGSEEMTEEEKNALITDVAKAVVETLKVEEVVAKAISEAIKPIQDKVDSVEKMASGSQQIPPTNEPNKTEIQKNFWGGVL